MEKDFRDKGIDELVARLKSKKTDIGLLYFKKRPSGELDPKKAPAVLLMEGVDRIVKPSGRSSSDYPAMRALELTFECVVNSSKDDPRLFFKKVRRALFLRKEADFDSTNPDDIVVRVIENKVSIRENRADGPFGYGLPKINGMKLVIDLLYSDEGI